MRSDQQANEEIGKDSNEAPAVSDNYSQFDLLLNTVNTDLIPRLFDKHMGDVPGASRIVHSRSSIPADGPWTNTRAIQKFAHLCLLDETALVQARIADLLTKGISLESVYLYFLTPVANYLGELWSKDRLSFAEVQLGMCCLQQLVFNCESIGYSAYRENTYDRSILLSSTPGEDHTFGTTMVAEFFRRYGWYVENASGLSSTQVVDRLRGRRYMMVGFSLHSVDHYGSLEQVIKKVRKESANADIQVLVGGHYFNSNPDKVLAIGADESASTGYDAVLLANRAHPVDEIGV